MKSASALLFSTLLIAACGGNGDGETNLTTAADTWFKPTSNSTWHIQLQGSVNIGYDVDLYDIDLYDSPASLINDLHAQGRHVICYFSAGSYEDWRDDAADFNSADLGNPLAGWPGEYWLDVRSTNVRSIMTARLDLAASKGCDGVDPDNVDGYTNNTGFPLTAADQLEYNRFLAAAAHDRGLAIGLKNDLEQTSTLVTSFDFAINESCHDYTECDLLNPFADAVKPILNIEYDDSSGSQYISNVAGMQALCGDAATRGFYTLVLPLGLDDSYRYSCD